ncbi:MAG TPA: methyltransferase domain-containing protein [Planctomycetota bacterium]|nr:methyltransferase domain-containing protein [Planctomycetota bacterium]
MSAPLGRLKHWIRRTLRRLGLEVEYVGRRASVRPAAPTDAPVAPYLENPEQGPGNLAEKLQREAEGGPFEWPNVVALNRAVAGLVGDAKRLVELGGGTGCFAIVAARDETRTIVCSELDVETSRWAAEHRARANVTYVDRAPTADDGPFDLVVAVEVIEHVADFVGFLRTCCSLAPRALITTPNRTRGPKFDVPGPPPVAKHVREWTAGEFYWVLRTFYRTVKLYAMPNPFVPELVGVRITTKLTPLVADCCEPRSLH